MRKATISLFISLFLSVPPDGTILIGLSLELYIWIIPVAGSFKTNPRCYIPFVFRLTKSKYFKSFILEYISYL